MEEERIEDINKKLEALESRLDSTENLFKENQANFFTAIRIFIRDSYAYKQGKKGFPESALYGLITAYFRPRVILTVGALFGALFTGVQTYLLINQTKIIADQSKIMQWQSELMETETWSNKAATIAEIMGTLKSVNDTANVDLIMPFLWLLEGQGQDFISTSRSLEPSYLSVRSWDESFRRYSNGGILQTKNEIDEYVWFENEFIQYYHKFNLPYETFKERMFSVATHEYYSDSLYDHFMRSRIFGNESKGNDFLDSYRRVFMEEYKSNINQPIYEDIRFMLTMIIPNFFPGSDDVDLEIRDKITENFFNEAQEIWTEDLDRSTQLKPLTNRMDVKLKNYFSQLKKLLLEKRISQIRERPNMVSNYFK